jgi:hypothetical protein
MCKKEMDRLALLKAKYWRMKRKELFVIVIDMARRDCDDDWENDYDTEEFNEKNMAAAMDIYCLRVFKKRFDDLDLRK